MKIIGEGYTKIRKFGEMSSYKCSECGAEYTDIADANACQAKHFDDRQKKRSGASSNLAALDAPSIRTKPKISVNKTASALPPEDDNSIPVLVKHTTADTIIEVENSDENDLQGLADRLLEQYK